MATQRGQTTVILGTLAALLLLLAGCGGSKPPTATMSGIGQCLGKHGARVITSAKKVYPDESDTYFWLHANVDKNVHTGEFVVNSSDIPQLSGGGAIAYWPSPSAIPY